MKKCNWVFIGECGIVIVLLTLIMILARDEKKDVRSGETVNSVIEVSEESGNKDARESFASIEETDVPEISVKESNSEIMFEEESTIENNSSEENIKLNKVENTEDKVKIVVFGDSIWADGRGEDGISEQIMEQLDVEIYNCSIGGTAAALEDDNPGWDKWDSRSFNGMMYVATDIINADDLMPNDAACEVIKNVDFEEIDYVIVSYGLNDYFSDITIYPEEYYDMSSYVGALRHGIQKLREEYPNLEFIITSPTYCDWFAGERQFELGQYVEAARGVATEMGVHFLDMYHAFGKNADEKTEYLEDGVHLNAEGRWLYSRSVIDCLNELEKVE